MLSNQKRVHFVDIDNGWNSLGVIMHRDEILVFVRSFKVTQPNLKDMRTPGHLLTHVQDAPTHYFRGQPAGTTALAMFRANAQGGGLLIASFGPTSAFDKRVDFEKHMPVTVY